MINIVNHSVECNDLNLLQFFYPNYVVLYKPVLFSDKNIIFTGSIEYTNQMNSLGVDIIYVNNTCDYNLNDRKVLLEMVFSKWNKEIPKYLDFYNDIDYDLFINLCKQCWITGKWYLKSRDKSGVFVDFLKCFKTSTYNITKTYLELLNKTGPEYIEVSLLTFLNRVVNNNENVNKWYLKVIDSYRNSKMMLIEDAVNNYCDSSIYRTDLRLLNLILDLNRRLYN